MGISASGKYSNEDLEKFRSRLSLKDEFSGGEPNLKRAEDLLHKTGLWADLNMRSLLEMRGHDSNKLFFRKLVLSLSSEAKSNLQIAGHIKIPIFVNISPEYKKVIEEQYELALTVSVKFKYNILQSISLKNI